MRAVGRAAAAAAAALLAVAVLLPAFGPAGAGPGSVAAAEPTPHPPIAGFDCPDELGGMKVVRAEWFGSDELGEAYCRYERYTFGERGRWASVQARWSDPDICTRPGPDLVTTVLPAATDQPVVLDVGPVTQVEERAPGRMAWTYSQASELADAGAVAALSDAFLAEAASRSPACPGASPAPEGDCVFSGVVTDGGWESATVRATPGHPIRAAKVTLIDRALAPLASSVTDGEGRYSFSIPAGALAGVDLANDLLAIRIGLAESAHEPSRYEVHARRDDGSQLAEVDSDEFTWHDECGGDGLVERDFPLGDLPPEYDPVWPPRAVWPAVAEFYDRIGRAFELMDLLKTNPGSGLPLPVYTFATGQVDFRGIASWVESTTAFWSGTLSDDLPDRSLPYVAFGTRVSLLQDSDWPRNREYHETGHAFLADAFDGAMPNDSSNVNHAGFYANDSSTDSWTEGFAEWFSMMVSKHVDGGPRPELYPAGGGTFDLELDYRPWLAWGRTEELAVAGVLLDLEDGPADYAAPPGAADLRILWHAVTTDWAGNRFVVGRVRNLTPAGSGAYADYAEMNMVAAVFSDTTGRPIHTAWGPTIPWDLPGPPAEGAEIEWPVDGLFVIPVPAGLAWADLGVTAFEGRPGTTATDDDPIDLDLVDLWDSILAYGSSQPGSNGYTFDVVDLHDAVMARFGGRDADENGLDDVDQVFIAHGFFADGDGDRSWLQGQAIGQSDHAGAGEYGAQVPRRDYAAYPGARVAVDTGGVAATFLVTVSLPDRPGYGYVARPGDDGRIAVIAPPPGSGGRISIVALADGYLPALAGEIEADAYWTAIDAAAPDAPGPSFAVTMTAGAVGPIGSNAGPGPGPAGLLLAAGGIAAAASAGLLLVRRRARRRAIR